MGFYDGEDQHAYHVLGGNQSDSVSVARVAKDRLLGALLASAIHVLSGAVTAVIIAVAVSEVLPEHKATAAVLIVAAFAIAFVPELGVRTLLRISRLWLSSGKSPRFTKLSRRSPSR